VPVVHPAASDILPAFSAFTAIANPLPSVPSRWSAGTRSPSYASSACVEPRIPIFRTVPTTRKPGMSGRMMKAVGRSTGSPFFITSVWANVVITPARWPLPIQCFRPSRIHSAPSALGRARVTMCCASDPVSGSVSA
jgi:hypothetical protein